MMAGDISRKVRLLLEHVANVMQKAADGQDFQGLMEQPFAQAGNRLLDFRKKSAKAALVKNAVKRVQVP